MNFLCYKRILWTKKTGSAKLSSSSKPKRLKFRPPADHVLELNIERAQFQYLVRLSCLEKDPPDVDPCEVNKKLLFISLYFSQYMVHIEQYIDIFSFSFL